MKKGISLLLVALICFSLIIPISAVSSKTAALEVSQINGSDTSVYVNGAYVGEAPFISNVAVGSKVKLVSSNDSFMFYTDELNNTLSENGEYEFDFLSAEKIKVWSENTNASKIFIYHRNTNDTKQVLSYATYRDMSAFNSYLVDGASKFGETFVSWNKTIDEVKGLATSGEKNIVIEPVYAASSETVTVSAVNGTVNGLESTTVLVGSQVKLSAGRAELDKPFAYWMDSEGNIVSDKAEFTAVVGYDETYYAVYLDEAPVLSPSTFIKSSYSESIDRLIVYTVRFVPTGVNIQGNGILYVKDTEYDTANMTLDNVGDGTLLRQAHICTNTSGSILNRVSCEEYVYIRPYIIAENGDVIYGQAVKCTKLGDTVVLVG